MNLINNLIPSSLNKKDFLKKISKNKLYKDELEHWHFNDKIYAKIYFERVSSKDKTDFKSVICKSRDYNGFQRIVISYYDGTGKLCNDGFIAEFYIDRDFEFNSVWENIYTTI